MTVIARWKGNGLSAGHASVNSIGEGDFPSFSRIASSLNNNLEVRTVSALPDPPTLRVSQLVNNSNFFEYTFDNPIPTFSMRVYFRLTQSGNVLGFMRYVAARLDNANLWCWSIDTSRRTIINPGAGGSLPDTRSGASETVAANTNYRLEIRGTSNQIEYRVFSGSDETPLFENGGEVPTDVGFDQLRFGASWAIGTHHHQIEFDDILVTDTHDWIGPLDPGTGPGDPGDPELSDIEFLIQDGQGNWQIYDYVAVKEGSSWDDTPIESYSVHQGYLMREFRDLDYTQGG